MSDHLEIRGVYRKRRHMRVATEGRFEGIYWQYFLQFLPWNGRYVPPQHICKEFYEDLIAHGVEKLSDRES